MNSHLLKGVATMAELTKADNRQPMGKIKPTDKMVMMPSLFDGTKPAMSKQHYERFNLYINFQTKSGYLTDPVGEAIDLFEHMLDKTALVWSQTNRSKFKDLTMLKMMFLQRYNPWGKMKREQLQSWNILSFNPKTTDVDEHIDLINTLGDMVDQKEEAKKENFIETMATMIQTHLIMCKNWATVKDTDTVIDQYLHDRMTPATLSPSPLAYEKPIHPAEMPRITTHTELPVDNMNKSTPDDKYPWLDPDDIRRNMTDKEILRMKLNLKDSVLDDKEKEEFLTKVEQFTDIFSLRDEIGTCPFIEIHLKLKDETPFFV